MIVVPDTKVFCFAENLEVKFNWVVSAVLNFRLIRFESETVSDGFNFKLILFESETVSVAIKVPTDKFPLPNNVVPFTVLIVVPDTKVFCFELKVFQSVDVKKPFAEVVACVIDKVLFAVKLPPPCNGAVVDIVIVLFAGVNPKAACLLLNVVQSLEVKYPFLALVALNNSIVGVVVLLSIEIGLPAVVAAFTVVTVPAPIALRKLAAVKAETLLSTLNLGKVIAEGFVKVNIDCPMVVPPRLVRPVDGTKSVLPPSHFSLSVNAVFQFDELFVIEVVQVVPVDKAMPASG